MKRGLKAVLLALVALSCAAGVALAQEEWVILHYFIGDGFGVVPEYLISKGRGEGIEYNYIGMALANGIDVYLQYFPYSEDAPVVRSRGVLESSARGPSGRPYGVGRWEEVERLSPAGEMDPLDPGVFVDALDWVRRMAPGKKVFLVFTSHGGGWQGVGSPLPRFEDGTPKRWKAIAEAIRERGGVDFLVLSSCLSAVPETLSAMEGIAPWVQAWGWIVSGDPTRSTYWGSLYWKNAASGEEVPRWIVEWKRKEDGESAALAMIQTIFRPARMEAVLQVLREMAQRDRDGLIEAIEEATRRMPEYGTYDLCDVAYLVEALKKRGMDSDRLIRAWGEALLDGSVAGRTDLRGGLSGLLTLGGEDLSEWVIRSYAAACEEFAFLQPLPPSDLSPGWEEGGGCSIGSAGSPIFLTALVLFVAANLRR